MSIKQPPQIGGVMDLTPEQETDLKAKLEAIVQAFEPTDEQPVCDTFYVTATYNRDNEFKLNGDTVEYLLQPQTEEQTPITGV
jgi:hypothetical protein